MRIGSIKPHIVSLSQYWSEEAESLRIPTIQRQFVWDGEDVKELLDSIINGYPIGAIIIWEPASSFPSAPLVDSATKSSRRYVLDGQQRLTALSLIRNNWCIQRDKRTLTVPAIYYVPETGRLYLGGKKGIDLSLIIGASLGDFDNMEKLKEKFPLTYRKAIQAVGQRIVNYQLPMYVLKTDSGSDPDAYEKIADIFTRVNSAGVKVGNLEMFLSFFAAAFPKKEKDRIISIHEALSQRFELDLEPLVRFVFSRMGMSQNSITKVESFKRSIAGLKERYASDAKKISGILNNAESAINTSLDLLDEEFGISSTQYIPSQNALLPLFDWIYQREYGAADSIPKKERRCALYWFLVASVNGIYSSSPNYKIDEDLQLVRSARASFPLDELLRSMKNRPPRAFEIDKDTVLERYNVLRGRTGKQFLMLLDIVLFRNRATDWTGKVVKSEEAAVHHLFPRELLKANGEAREDLINSLGNLTLINPSINSEIADTPPETYLRGYIRADQDIFEQHMIPRDQKLWKLENFEKFVDTRSKLIWKRTKELIDELSH